jgi:hypothetical protein
VSLADILGGKMLDAVVDKANDALESTKDEEGISVDVVALLERAEKEIEAQEVERRAKEKRRVIVVKGVVDVQEVAAFSVYGMPKRSEPHFRALPLTEGQKDVLRKQGVPFERLESWQQRELFRETVKRFNSNKCSYRQAKLLQRFGHPTNCSFAEAKVIIDRLSKNNWKQAVD